MPKLKTAILCFLCCLRLFAQDFEFENISTKDGLSQNDVNCIFQDKQGFMWFGTNDGLNRFDGYEFKKYRYEVNAENGLSSNIVQTIAQDNNQDIWIGTADGGVNVIKYLSDQIMPPSFIELEQDLLEKKSVNQIAMLDDLAIVMTKEELFFFRQDGDTYRNVKVNNNHFLRTGSKYTNCYQEVSKNKLYIGTKKGLKILNIEEGAEIQATITSHLGSLNIYRIEPFREGHLVYCLLNKLYYVDEQLSITPIIKEDINCLLVENEKSIWIGTNSGLDYVSFENDSSLSIASIKTYNLQSTQENIGGNLIKTIFRDKTGLMWLGIDDKGVTKAFEHPHKFKLFNQNTNSKNYFRGNVSCFLEDAEQKLWIGTSEGTISYFERNNYNYNKGKVEVLNLGKQFKIRLLSEVHFSGQTYIIAANMYSTKVQLFNLQANPITDTPLNELFHKIIRPTNAIIMDGNYMWIGTNEGGLYRYDHIKNSVTHFLTRNTPTLCSNLINTLYIDANANLLIGTNKGLNIVSFEERNKPNPTFQKFTHIPGDSNSLSYNHISSILQHSNKEIWLGTLGGGLNKFNIDERTFSCLSSGNGLASNSIKNIVEDNQQLLWVSSNEGLSSINVSTQEITNFSPSDGLQDYEFTQRAYCKRDNGELLFGGKNGFNSFYPQLMKRDSTRPELVFTGLNVVSPSEDKDVYYNSGKLLEYIEDTQTMQFRHNENSFTAYFSSLNYFAPAEVEYKYRLLGFEENWSNTNNQTRFAKYTNLHPGDYVLEVLATNSDGIWLNKPLQLNISIGKAWYKNNIAFAVYSLLLISVFVFFNRYSLIQNKIKNNLLMERFEKEKVKQLSQLKLRFFTNISHELRTPVTIIKSYFENIAPNWQNLSEEKVNKDFSVITRNVNLLNRLLNQLLDFRKLEQDKMTLVPEKGDIVKLIESCIASFNIIAINKKIDLIFQHDCDKLEFWYDENKMEKIINNIISNALKYTNESGKVVVRLNELEEEIKIEIEDNGIGIPEYIQSNIFERFSQASSLKKAIEESTGIGLSLAKGLIDLHKGRIELISSEGSGSNFILFFKKGSSHFQGLDLQHSKPIHNRIFIETSNDNIHDEVKNMDFSTGFTEKLILIVEDNEDLRSFLVEKLKSFFKVDFAENGKIGLKKCIEKTPDIVISDIMMPEMNGYELCDTIKNNETISHIPVILLTAKINADAELHGFKLGADAYVGKPFNLDILVARIESILKSREKIWKKIGENPFFSPSEVTFTVKDEQFLHKITTIIEEHMSHPDFSVEQLAEKCDISKINLNNKIKALTGKTTVQFIRLLRLRRAAELLKTNHCRVSDVTYDVGYSDLQHFRKHFKKEFSLSPSDYKKKYSSN